MRANKQPCTNAAKLLTGQLHELVGHSHLRRRRRNVYTAPAGFFLLNFQISCDVD